MIYLTNLIEHPKNRFFLLLGASICFYLLRFSDAQLPFFWDELHAYVQGTIYMVDHKISMLPSAVPDNISFGHPLLLFFINAIWVKIFGISPLAFHSLSIVITLFTAFGCYILAIQITRNYIVGILSFVIFLFQPIVVAQSTQVLLEMLLTCTIVFALYFHIRGKFLYSVLCATLAVLTKETGLVLAIALPFALVIHYLFVERSSLFLKATLIHLIPFLVFAAFLVIQKQTYGWYLNPNNLNATKIEFNSITQRAWDYSLKFVWLKQGRWFLSVISLVYLVVLIAKRKLKNGLNATMAVLLVFSFGFMIFSSIASCLHRYFLVMMPIVSVTFAITLYRINEYKKNVGILLLIIGLVLNLYFLNDKTQNSEVNLSYKNQVVVNKLLFDYLNQPKFDNKKVKLDFPIFEATKDYRFGFNGHEKDDEVSGAGNTMTAMFWEYDARLGRRWNIDPKPITGISEYACFANNPIVFRDLNGDKIGEGKERAQKIKNVAGNNVKANDASLRRLNERIEKKESKGKTPEKLYRKREVLNENSIKLKQMIRQVESLENDPNQVYNFLDSDNGYNETKYDVDTKEINFYTNGTVAMDAHEMTHGYQFKTGKISYRNGGAPGFLYDLNDEYEAYMNQYLIDPVSVGFLISLENIRQHRNSDQKQPYIGLSKDNLTSRSTVEQVYNANNLDMDKPTLKNSKMFYVDFVRKFSTGEIIK